MSADASETPIGQPPCYNRNVFLTKGDLIGILFLNSHLKHTVWTFDPRTMPPFHWFEHETREIAEQRFKELLRISVDNGWTVRFDGPRNYT